MAFLSGLFSAKGLAIASAIGAGVYAFRKHMSGGVCRYDETNTRLDGKTVVITGANTGIGLESAVLLARMGATVVMACRDEQRGAKALDAARARVAAAAAAGNSGGSKNSGSQSKSTGRLELMRLDLADLQSVRKFAAEFKAKHSRCHVLLNNAGVMMCPHWHTVQGLEMQFGTNHLGHFLLTHLLLDTLKASGSSSAPARVVNVSSNAHRRGTIDLTDLDWQKRDRPYEPVTAYGASKVANILFTRELARRCAGTGAHVTAYALHPGVVRTDLWRHLDWRLSAAATLLKPLLWLTTKDAVAGAQTNVWCAVAPELNDEKCNGGYYADCAPRALMNPQGSDAALAQRLWDVSQALVDADARAELTGDPAVAAAVAARAAQQSTAAESGSGAAGAGAGK